MSPLGFVGLICCARPGRRLILLHGTRSSRPPSRQRARPDGGAGAGAGNHPDGERPDRSGRHRRHRRHLRDQGRPAQRRQGRREGLERSGLCRLAEARRHRRDRLARLYRPAGRAHAGGVQHGGHAQPRRLHAVLLLSVVGARPAAGLVQGAALPLARGDRSARRAGGIRPDPSGGHENPRLGFDRRAALSRRAAAARRHRGLERGTARRPGHPRFDDRHRACARQPA